MSRDEACACGGPITARADDSEDVAAQVLLHNRGPRHVAYMLGERYEPALIAADWHYTGGRDTGTRVPFGLTQERTPVRRVDNLGTTTGCVEPGLTLPDVPIDASERYPQPAYPGGEHSWSRGFRMEQGPPTLSALSKAQLNTGGRA